MTMHSLKSSLQFHVLLSLTMFTVRALISGKYSVNFIQIHRLVITKDGTAFTSDCSCSMILNGPSITWHRPVLCNRTVHIYLLILTGLVYQVYNERSPFYAPAGWNNV